MSINKKNKNKNFANIIFICITMVLLFSGLIRTIFFPKDINYYENRYMSIPAPFEPTVRTLRATIPALGASIPVIGNHHSG